MIRHQDRLFELKTTGKDIHGVYGGYETKEVHEWLLLRELYGLKQPSKPWFDNLSAFFILCRLQKSQADTTMYVRQARQQ